MSTCRRRDWTGWRSSRSRRREGSRSADGTSPPRPARRRSSTAPRRTRARTPGRCWRTPARGDAVARPERDRRHGRRNGAQGQAPGELQPAGSDVLFPGRQLENKRGAALGTVLSPELATELGDDLHVVRLELVALQLESPARLFDERARPALRRGLPGEEQEILDDAGGARGLVRHDPEALAHLLRRLGIREQELRLAEDRREGVVDLMRDPRGELAHGGQLLSVDELCVGAPELLELAAHLGVEAGVVAREPHLVRGRPPGRGPAPPPGGAGLSAQGGGGRGSRPGGCWARAGTPAAAP